MDSDEERKLDCESVGGWVGGSPGDGGGGFTTTERERERRLLPWGREIRERGRSQERAQRGACGGCKEEEKEKEEEERGLKLQGAVVGIGDLQINKTSRLPETLNCQTEGHQID